MKQWFGLATFSFDLMRDLRLFTGIAIEEMVTGGMVTSSNVIGTEGKKIDPAQHFCSKLPSAFPTWLHALLPGEEGEREGMCL